MHIRFLFAAFAFSIVIGMAAPQAVAQTITTLFVDAAAATGGDGSDWITETPFKYLQDALDEAASINPQGSDRVQILVRSKWGGGIGIYTYYPDEDEATGPSPDHVADDRDESFHLHDRIELYSGFDGTESSASEHDTYRNGRAILSGDLDGDDNLAEFLVGDYDTFADNARHVVVADDVDETAVLDGFTIERGYIDDGWLFDSGGGVFLSEAEPTLQRCVIQYNFSASGGGGMYVIAPLFVVSPVITECTFYRNRDGGGFGGGLYVAGNATVVQCAFTENNSNIGGGGAWFTLESEVINCTFTDNFAEWLGGGLVVFASSASQVTNCIFNGNSATSGGGGLVVNGGTSGPFPLTINQCTFAANQGGGTGGGIRVFALSSGHVPVRVNNGILWGNTSSGSAAQDQIDIGTSAGDVGVQYSDVQDGVPSALDDGNNIDDDPLFRGSTNFFLQYGSPCIDTGSNAILPDDVADLDDDSSIVDDLPEDLNGDDRIQDGDDDTTATVDMGAYELAPPSTCAADINGNCTVNGVDLALLLGAWGPCSSCDEDINGDDVVNGFDLAILLGMWGPCEDCELLFGGGEEESEDDEDYPLLLWWLLTGDYAAIFEWADALN